MATKPNYNGIAIIVSLAAIIISIVGTCQQCNSNKLSKQNNEFQQNSFKIIQDRDSIQSIKNDSVVNKQLNFLGQELLNLNQKNLLDSLFYQKQIQFLNFQLYSQQLEVKISYMKSLTELKNVISNIQSVQKRLNLNPVDSSDLSEYRRMLEEIVRNLKLGKTNSLIFMNEKLDKKWDDLIEKTYVTEISLNNRYRIGFGVNEDSSYNLIISSLFKLISNEVTSIDSTITMNYKKVYK